MLLTVRGRYTVLDPVSLASNVSVGSMVLKNDFPDPSAPDWFKIRRQRATLIQKSIRLDSIVAYSYSTDFSR